MSSPNSNLKRARASEVNRLKGCAAKEGNKKGRAISLDAKLALMGYFNIGQVDPKKKITAEMAARALIDEGIIDSNWRDRFLCTVSRIKSEYTNGGPKLTKAHKNQLRERGLEAPQSASSTSTPLEEEETVDDINNRSVEALALALECDIDAS